jgi:signal transduction histidine kinase
MSSALERIPTRAVRRARLVSEHEQSSGRALAIGGGVVALVGIIDYATGPHLTMTVVYLIPVAWATSVAGRPVGVGVAILSTVSGALSDILLPGSSHGGDAIANVVMMLVTLLVVVVLIDRARERALAAQAAEDRSREFLRFAAHQLRTPLARINSAVGALMLDSVAPGDQEELLAGLGNEAERAGRLLNSLLRMARLDQHDPLPLRTADICHLTREEVDRAARARTGLRWNRNLPAVCPIRISCDPEGLAEAIANLLDNAARHALHQVTVAVGLVGSAVQIDISDDGPGIRPAEVDAAFRRFVTLEPGVGTGLGLPIARAIAEAHGGTLVYEDGRFKMLIPGNTNTARI